MNATPIDVLFHHGANCDCEQCQKTLKPFRSGKFLTKDEINQINADIKSLVDENTKLQSMLEKLAEEKLTLEKHLEQQQQMAETVAKAQREEAEEEQAEEPAPKTASKTITLVIDTSNIVYIAVIAILIIMVIKK